jgi:hypothetical protein
LTPRYGIAYTDVEAIAAYIYRTGPGVVTVLTVVHQKQDFQSDASRISRL